MKSANHGRRGTVSSMGRPGMRDPLFAKDIKADAIPNHPRQLIQVEDFILLEIMPR